MRSRDSWKVVLIGFVTGVLGGIGGRLLTSGALQRAIDSLGDDVAHLRERVQRRESWDGVRARQAGNLSEAQLLAQVQALALGNAPQQRSRRSSHLPGRFKAAPPPAEPLESADAGEGGSEE